MVKNLVYLIIVFCFIDNLYSQNIYIGPRSISMGSTGIAGSHDIESISLNPANLAFDKKSVVFTIIPSFGFDAGNSIINYDIYKKYFTGVDNGNGVRDPKYLNQADKDYILSLFPSSESGNIGISAEVNLFSITVHLEKHATGFGFKIKDKIMGKINFPKDAFKLLLYGNTPGYTYSFDNMSGYSNWVREFALAAGKMIIERNESKLSIGISAKYLNGLAMAKTKKIFSNMVTNDTAIEGRLMLNSLSSYSDFLKNDYQGNIFASPAGKGFAADIGASWIINEAFKVGINISDLGFINWSKNVEEVYIDTLAKITNITSDDQYKPFKDIINRHKVNLNENKEFLPLGIHLGGELTLSNLSYFKKRKIFPIKISTDIHYIYFSSLQKPDYLQFGLGVELFPVSWLPVRLGGSYGYMPFTFSFGTGINTGNFDIELGLGNLMTAFTARSVKSAALSFGMKFKIN